MKKIRIIIASIVAGVGLFTAMTTFDQHMPVAHAAHTIRYVPSRYRHTWGTWDGDWFRLTTHTESFGYLQTRGTYAGVGFSKIYSKNHIRVYGDNMPIYDLKLKHYRNKFYQDQTKHWYLYLHEVGTRTTVLYRK